MNDALQKQLGDLLQKLGIGINDALPLLVRYTIYDAAVSLIGSAVFLVLLALLFKVFWRRSEGFDEDDKGLVRGIVSAVFTVVAFILLLMFFSSISTLIEPRGYLIHKIISGVSK